MCAKVMLNMRKTIQMSDFIPNGVGKILCYSILLRNVWKAGHQSCSSKAAFG